MKVDVYKMVTDRVIEQLKQGVVPWRKPWTGGSNNGAVSHESGKPYSLLNQLLLGVSGEWLTYGQIQKDGGRIKKGEKASFCVFYKIQRNEYEKEDGTMCTESYPVLKYYNVWNVEQTEGIKAKYKTAEDVIEKRYIEPIESAEQVVTTYQQRESINIHREKTIDRACYSVIRDAIYVPEISQFDCAEEYYSTLFHEITHSTGSKNRLSRDGIISNDGFGTKRYAREELVAELGAAYMCNLLGIETESSFRNNTAYINDWCKAMKADNRMIVYAAGKAEAATNYILNGKEKQ